MTDNDLFAVDDSDSDEELKKKSGNFFLDLNENSNSNIDEQIENSKSKDVLQSSLESKQDAADLKKLELIVEHNESHSDSEIENESENESYNETKKTNAFDKLKQIKESDSIDKEKQGFFEDEAELSGNF